jgi:hypothetical protein
MIGIVNFQSHVGMDSPRIFSPLGKQPPTGQQQQGRAGVFGADHSPIKQNG